MREHLFSASRETMCCCGAAAQMLHRSTSSSCMLQVALVDDNRIFIKNAQGEQESPASSCRNLCCWALLSLPLPQTTLQFVCKMAQNHTPGACRIHEGRLPLVSATSQAVRPHCCMRCSPSQHLHSRSTRAHAVPCLPSATSCSAWQPVCLPGTVMPGHVRMSV